MPEILAYFVRYRFCRTIASQPRRGFSTPGYLCQKAGRRLMEIACMGGVETDHASVTDLEAYREKVNAIGRARLRGTTAPVGMAKDEVEEGAKI